MARFAYGGQALMEGVLMRGRDAIGVAVRGPDGQIFGAQEKLNSVLHRNRFARAPFFRGVVVLYETLVIGTRWLMRSGSLAAAGEGVAMGGRAVALTFLFTIVFAVGLFVLLPLLLAQGATSTFLSGWLTSMGIQGATLAFVQHLIEALVRIVIFVGYLLVVSRSADIRRVFQYHGAEHMTIHVLEHELPLTVENARKYPTAHPRCGTEFLVVFILVSIILFSLLAGQDLIISILGRIVLIPVVAAIAYEVLRWGAKRRENWAVRWLFLPGIWLQAITTKQPDDSMIEVAIASMHEALAANGETAPEGSLVIERVPMPDANELVSEYEAREAASAAQPDVAAAVGATSDEPAAAGAPATTTALEAEPGNAGSSGTKS